MTERKRMMSNGLAFAEEKDMKQLRKKASQGWLLKRFRGLGYEFEKGTPEDVVFTIDYQDVRGNEKEEYIEMFEMAGWTYVCSSQEMHIFKAKHGTKPIYSDAETEKGKYVRLQAVCKMPALISVMFTIITFIIFMLTEETVSTIFSYVFSFSFIVTLPLVFTYGAATYRMIRKRGQIFS